MVVDEEAQKAQQKRAEANRKRREREKRKREEKAGQGSGEADKATKKLRTTDSDTAQKVTIYVEIHPPAPQQSSKSGKKSIRPIVKRGPAFFTLNDNFDEFKKIIAKTIPCKPKLLPIDKMEWRYEKPANDPKKPLVSAEGFEAMNISLLERKTGFVLYISIPPPKQDDAVSLVNSSCVASSLTSQKTWDTGEGDHVEKPYDYFEETWTAPDETLSAKAQIVSSSESSARPSHLRLHLHLGGNPVGLCSMAPTTSCGIPSWKL